MMAPTSRPGKMDAPLVSLLSKDPDAPGTVESAPVYLELRLHNGTTIFIPRDDCCIPVD